jgi:hypothetical protein
MKKILELKVPHSFDDGTILGDVDNSLAVIGGYIDSNPNIDAVMFKLNHSPSAAGNAHFQRLALGVQDYVNTTYVSSLSESILKSSWIASLCDFNTLELSSGLYSKHLADKEKVKIHALKPSCIMIPTIVYRSIIAKTLSINASLHFLFNELDYDDVILPSWPYTLVHEFDIPAGKRLISSKDYYDIFDTYPLFKKGLTVSKTLVPIREYEPVRSVVDSEPKEEEIKVKDNKKHKLIEID